MAQGEFLWCDLATFEVEEVLPVYAELLDWTFRSETFADGSIYHYATNEHDVTAGVYEMPSVYRKDGMRSFWMSYVGISDIVEGIDVAVSEGGRVVLGPASFGMGASIAMIADPDGAIVTLFSGSHLQNRHQNMVHGVHFWNELFTEDLDRSQSFYNKLFGWKFEAAEPGALNVRNMAGAPTTRIQQLTTETFSGTKPHWAVSFAADDLSVIKDRCEKLALRSKKVAGIEGSDRLCITDPRGATFYALPVDPKRTAWFT